MNVLSKGKPTGFEKPFKLEEIWRIRTRLELENDEHCSTLRLIANLEPVIYLSLKSIMSHRKAWFTQE